MIGRLKGTIENNANPLLVDIAGVGYVVHVPPGLAPKLKVGTTETLHIHTHVREDALDLYGFTTSEELRFFTLLLTVSGIGPKTALLVVDHGAKEVERAVRSADVDFFTTIPRLGRKNAQKIIIELKNKLGSLEELNLSDESGEAQQVVDALLTMGFERSEALSAIKKLPEDITTVEKKLRAALKLLAKK